MKYISVGEFAEKHGILERTARNYCTTGKIEGVFLTGKKFIEEILTNWNIPYDKQTSAGKTSSLHAKDPDGNELCLLRKDIYVGMPIGN